MSENWISKIWFDSSNTGTVNTPDTAVVVADTLLQSGEEKIYSGSGALPAIRVTTDYSLRDEYNEVLMDETGEGLSLEGLNA